MVDGRLGSTGFDARYRLYRALTALRSVTWCCRALVRYRGSTGHTTEKTARKLPVSLSDKFTERIARALFAAAPEAQRPKGGTTA